MIPYIKGTVTKQAHVGIPDSLYEEEYGRKGFYGRYAHLYRQQPPVAWSRIEGNLKPQAYHSKTRWLERIDFPRNRFTYMYNDDVKIQIAGLQQAPDYFFRNADGDEVYFIHAGEGDFYCDFGKLTYTTGDYIVIPRGTVYKFAPKTFTKFLIVESKSEVSLPDKGLLGKTAFFDPALMKVPDPAEMPAFPKQVEYQVTVKRCDEFTNIYYPHHPLNVVGWKGDLTVWQINVADIRPITCERYHLPPSAHSTFVTDTFVIVTFLPRGLETEDPLAVKVPFYHSNIDYDEVIFYHAGEFFSRSDIELGMFTFHPQGIHHGPQKAAVERSKDARRTNEIAVMIDTLNPLKVAREAESCENKDYWKSWQH